MDIKIELVEREKELTNELQALRPEALSVYARLYDKKEDVGSFHGTIGGKNNTYVDSVNNQFLDPKEFITRWISGVLDKAREEEAKQRQKYAGRVYKTTSSHKILGLLQNEVTQHYITTFLTRNFYRNFLARTREKPAETLWQLWFGGGDLVWGLIISPVYRDSTWTNDKSEMRRAGYSYWTVRHVLETGLIDPGSAKPLSFNDLEQLLEFYRSVLKRVSNSAYERQVADFYCNYIEQSSAPLDEPFLIPELRYAGKDREHQYRLDYTILNPYTMEMIGFEISPASTHASIKKKGDKTLIEMNEELSKQWAKEVKKRNDYFETFGITTVTFADDQLKDMGDCYSKIEEYLSKRPEKRKYLDEVMVEVENFQL
ncbi:MAG: topoisomerase II [Pseudodesulfovibrio sp.]|uniref:Type IIA topoisomerase, A subunit n=1 Tax=Pseudodesulfovibrio aespoeensis (strain ATCC 700646 / DSM 10631 / Aspo-2) TaxID=643562 RepID=E6VX19_PSEA9|nr:MULTISPECIES: hypothetical protein [Pseudodesulfovibrio]MBU4474819.1 topoisomerase II [Pseudomonadota bacterium]ADU61425.1 type IIA topoisomerase, A subunit [Pseudodesulfovibrio aespoeensis Aspo-2]MBU4516311.1 topoisomerase II [Pseudomonadota bacterium]MBU4522492.1 topoisomerase II [Pseudomonadota bacterium]MBU4558692.1 topoisomerase II [Pseudomonadota bacterium]